MGTEDDRLVYQQRYETFRHLDRLRWEAPTIAIAGGSVLLGLSSSEQGALPSWWAVLIFGLLALLAAFLVFRIRIGMKLNDVVLRDFAQRLGDDDIPVLKARYGASWWMVLLLGLLGVASVLVALCQYVRATA